MSTEIVIVAIDGGSGAGKSSTARELAKKLSYMHVDTGVHYRAVAYCLQQKKIPYTNPEAIEHEFSHWTIDEELEGNEAHIRLNHKRFDESQLRSAMVNSEVSYYASVPIVRKFLLHFQRSQAQVARMNGFRGMVMEGRDIGTNIFPDTPFKYFFVADPKVKAQRRALDGGIDIIETRDLVDSTKGQLRKAYDAIKVDTTTKTVKEVVKDLCEDIATRLAK